jgi:hypothetical protein
MIARTEGTTDTAGSSPRIRRRRGLSGIDDVEKWYEIHHTSGHDLEECKTFLDRKKMPPPTASAPQELRRVDQHRVDSNGDEQMREINVIFRGSMSIASKT